MESCVCVEQGRSTHYLPPGRHVTDFATGDCGKGVWEPTLLEHGRTAYVDSQPESDPMISQFLQWMTFCNEKHTRKRCMPSNPQLPLRVIDVGSFDGTKEPFLSVGEGRKGIYVTLSYRWGSGMHYKMTTTSLESMKARMTMSDLPKTMHDAIRITRRFGTQYIWIDALCIIQNSKDDWQAQSALMYQIYSDSWLNISADRAQNADMGFLQQRGILPIRSCVIPNSLAEGCSSSRLAILPQLPHQTDQYLEGPFSRGWIFQERLFSRRVLHFGHFENAWQCHGGRATERMPLIKAVAGRELHDHRIDVHQDFPPGLQLAKCYDEQIWWCLRDWYREVALFSYTNFTNETDKFPAIAGLAKVYQMWLKGQSQYFAGIWGVDFPSGLAWRNASVRGAVSPNMTLASESRRRGRHFAINDLNAGRLHPHEDGYIAPSFSWASVTFPIHYDFKSKPEFDTCGRRSIGSIAKALTLVEVNVEHQGNAFGQVLNGWIKVRGITILYSKFLRLPQFRKRTKDFTALILDNGHYNPDPKSLPPSVILLFLRLLHYERAASNWDAMVLVPIGALNDEYRRVGYLVVAGDSGHPSLPIVDLGPNFLGSSRPRPYDDEYFAGWDGAELKIV